MGMIYLTIEEDKLDKIDEHLETSVHALDKAMRCIAELKQAGMAGQRGYAGNRMPDYGGMSGERRWANQYGHGGYAGNRDMGGGFAGNRMPYGPGNMPPVDQMYM